MKITIDTTFKPHKVEIEGDCSIGELIEFLSKYYPDFTWKDVRIGGKMNFQGFRGTQGPLGVPGSNPWIQPNTGTPWTIGDFPGPSITYCSDTDSFTNATGDTIQVSSLLGGNNIISG